MNELLEKIYKCVQIRHCTQHKPTALPISSIEEMEVFEQIDDNEYLNVVNKKKSSLY